MDSLGPDEDQCTEVRVLNRVIRWSKQGLQYELDQRHAEKVVRELGLENAKPVSTPWVEEQSNDKVNPMMNQELTRDEATRFRGIAARINYLAADRYDLLYASKCVSRWLSSPTHQAFERLKRIGRYLKGKPRLVQHFPWGDKIDVLEGFADSDWAGDKNTLKSTSGGAILIGGHCLKAWSTSQNTIALSSGEAELYAMTKVAVQLAGITSLAADFGWQLKGVARSDSNAAIGIAHRGGLGGRCRHIKVQYLWIQEKIKNKELGLEKVLGSDNCADLMTKALGGELFEKYVKMLNFEKLEGRAEKSSELMNVLTPSAVQTSSVGGCKHSPFVHRRYQWSC